MNLSHKNKFLLIIIFWGMIYVGFALSPSSYGVVLSQIGLQDYGLFLGKPRPIRSDEWAVVTPLTQALVNSEFKDINITSVYNESFKINYGLPIFDWGLVFKPTMWGYLFLPPAMAFSLHYFLIFSMFIFGYAYIFNSIVNFTWHSFAWSFAIYFTGFVQFWWSEKGVILAYFPIVICVLMIKNKNFIHYALQFWILACWFLSNLYPPLQISLLFVAAVIYISEYDFKFKNFLLNLTVLFLSGITSIFYLKDYLLATSKTIYPGRRFESGGSVPELEWMSQFFPTLLFDAKYKELSQNICEIGTVGGFVLFAMLFFVKYSSIQNCWQDNKRLKVYVFGLALMTLWMLFPVSAYVGLPLLWTQVQPERMEFAAGLLLMMIAAEILYKAQLLVNRKRIILFFVSYILIWWKYKIDKVGGIFNAYQEIYFIILISFMFMLRGKFFGIGERTILIISSTLASALIFFPFNPLQSAWPLFSKELKINADRKFNFEEKLINEVLMVEGFAGATLNGLGYKSVSHVTAVPQLKFWSNIFPELEKSQFDAAFNRYSHVMIVNDKEKPLSPSPDVVAVPLKNVQNYFLKK